MNYLPLKDTEKEKSGCCNHFYPNVNAFLKFAFEDKSGDFLRCLACGDLTSQDQLKIHVNRFKVIQHCIFISRGIIKCVICNQEIKRELIPFLTLSAHHRISTIARLANFGNTCYLNSVMQCLVTIPHFSRAISKLALRLSGQESSLVLAVVDFFNQVILQQIKPEKTHFFSLPCNDLLKPHALAESFRVEYPFFSVYEQQDAHEFFLLLMDSLDKTKLEDSRSLVDVVFRGKQRFTSVCGNCFARQNSSNDFICLSLSLSIPDSSKSSSPFISSVVGTCSEKDSLSSPVSEQVPSKSGDDEYVEFMSSDPESPTKHYTELVNTFTNSPKKELKGGMLSSLFCFGKCSEKSITLDEVFMNFFSEEELHFDRYSCSSCQSESATVVYRSTRLETLPPVLVLHLMRFRHENGYGSKGNESVQMRQFIDLREYCVDGADLSRGTKYVLSAAISHTGGLNNGHYTAFVRVGTDEKWVNANDDYCRDATFEEICDNPNIYITFYTKL